MINFDILLYYVYKFDIWRMSQLDFYFNIFDIFIYRILNIFLNLSESLSYVN